MAILTADGRKRLSAAVKASMRARWSDPDYRAMQSASHRKRVDWACEPDETVAHKTARRSQAFVDRFGFGAPEAARFLRVG